MVMRSQTARSVVGIIAGIPTDLRVHDQSRRNSGMVLVKLT